MVVVYIYIGSVAINVGRSASNVLMMEIRGPKLWGRMRTEPNQWWLSCVLLVPGT